MPFEIDFLPVGKSSGDAILVRYGNSLSGYTVHLTDGAYSDAADTIIKHINAWYDGAAIDHMVLSHADDDHATGLVEVLRRHPVRNLWMNRPWLYAKEVIDKFHPNYTVEGLTAKMRELHPYLVEMEKIANEKKIPIREAFQGTQIGDFRVMAPSRERYLRLIPELDKTPQSFADAAKALGGFITDAAKTAAAWIMESWLGETLGDDLSTSASNETSLIQWANIDNKRILLTADVGPEGLNEAANFAEINGVLAPPHFVQLPHHGSRHNVSRSTLNRGWVTPFQRARRTVVLRSAQSERATARINTRARSSQTPSCGAAIPSTPPRARESGTSTKCWGGTGGWPRSPSRSLPT